MSEIILLDEYHLNPEATNLPPLTATKIFCCDRRYYNHENFSLNRLVFIYSYLCEHEVEIIDGSVTDFLAQQQDAHYYVSSFLYQRHKSSFDKMTHTQYQIDSVIKQPEKSFRRFFPFWKVVKKQVMGAK